MLKLFAVEDRYLCYVLLHPLIRFPNRLNFHNAWELFFFCHHPFVNLLTIDIVSDENLFNVTAYQPEIDAAIYVDYSISY